MFIFRQFFKPKWQSSNAEVRLRAVSKLSGDEPESGSIIARLALEDQDALVRKVAIEKLGSLELLLKASQHDKSEENRQAAASRACELLVANKVKPEEQQQLLQSIASPDLLTRLILASDDPALQQAALARIQQDEHLITLLLNSPRTQLRCQIAEKINTPEVLEQLSRELRGKDKSVHRILRDKLKLIRETEKQRQARSERCHALVDTLEQMSAGEYFPQYAAKLYTLEQEWPDCAEAADSGLQQRFASALRTCTARVAEESAREAALAAEQARQREARQQRETLIAAAEQLQQQTATAESDATAQEQQLIQLQQQWQEALSDADSDQRRRFKDAAEPALQRVQARIRLQQQTPAIEQLLQRDHGIENSNLSQLRKQDRAAEKLLLQIDWPQHAPLPAPLRALRELRGALNQQLDSLRNAQQSLQHDLQTQLEALASAIDSGQVRTAERISKRAEQLAGLLNGATSTQLEQHYKSLHARLQELKDWQGYAVTPKKEALCREIEALIDSDLQPQQRARQLRQLQQQWRDLDATDSVHAHGLWKRFKAASDAAYAPCEAAFKQERQLRQHNLDARQEICRQLEAYQQSINWDEVDWKALEEILKTAKAEWRQYSPVDRAPGKEAQDCFNRLLQELEAPLKQQRGQNRAAKQALVERVQSLLDSEDLAAATETAKQLQQEWKSLGATFHSQERKLWAAFRQHCNALFDRYHQQRRQDSAQRQSAQEQITALCENLEHMQQAPQSLSLMHRKLEDAQAQYARLNGQDDQIPPHLSNRFKAASAYIEDQEAALAELQGAAYQALERKAVLCEQLEMALIEGHTENARTAVADAWQQGPALADAYRGPMNQRYAQLEALCEAPEQLHDAIATQEQRLRQLCIRLEIALGLPSPAEDQALRMEYQMQRLQQALAQQEKAPNLAAIKALEYEWLCVPFAGCYEELHQRFHRQLGVLH